MEEADAVASALGVGVPVSIERRIAGAAAVGAHKTSMLQDLESGRPMELEAVVGAVIELGEMLGSPGAQHQGRLRRRKAPGREIGDGTKTV